MPGTIAVLGGTGPEGFGLALRWARAGETVIIGSRDAQRAQDAAAKIKERVSDAKISGEENSAACAAADIVVVTVPFEAQAGLLKQIKPAIRPGCTIVDTPCRWQRAWGDAPRARSVFGKGPPRSRPPSLFPREFRW